MEASKMNIFLGGPITNILDSSGLVKKQFRNEVEGIIRYLCEHKYTIFSAHETERYGEETSKFTNMDILRRDFSWMEKCDLYIAYYASMKKEILRSDGTNIEIGWAYALNNPIIVICDFLLVSQLSLILQGMLQTKAANLFCGELGEDLIAMIQQSVRKGEIR